MSSITTSKTVETLQVLFAKYGLPEQRVSGSGPQFTSEVFMRVNGIKHICSGTLLSLIKWPGNNGLCKLSNK